MENLNMLMDLQRIDMELDDLKHLRGDLPDTIGVINTDLQQTKTRIVNATTFLKESEVELKNIQLEIDTSKAKIEKYKAQQFEVRNNREYDALTKEIDAQTKYIDELTIRSSNLVEQQDENRSLIDDLKPIIVKMEKDLNERNEQLELITKDTEEEERILLADRKKIVEKTDKRIIDMYERVRAARDGKVVVPMRRGACGGCFKVIPPQKQVEIRSAKKLHHCEHCGRILVSEDQFK